MSAARVERQGPRLLLITGLWPTPDAPSAGIFVKRRADQLPSPTVIAPRSYRGSTLIRYLALGLRALTARGRYDGVEVHWLFPTGLIGLIAARLRGIPLVVYAHGDDVMVTPWRSRVFYHLAKLSVRMADAVVTNSSESAEYLARLGAEAVVIPPGVDLDRFYPTPRPRSGRVLYLGGRVESHRKGLDVAAELADTLVGPGLEEVGPDEVPDLIRTHDVVLMPSRREAFGLVAAEAIASGRWVVARSVGGLKEIVQDGVNGFLVDDGDFEGALRRVPDYEPTALAATVGRFDAKQEGEAMNRLWARCLSGKRRKES